LFGQHASQRKCKGTWNKDGPVKVFRLKGKIRCTKKEGIWGGDPTGHWVTFLYSY